MIVIGAISGTSVDGIDVAAVHLTGAGTPRLHCRILAGRTVPWTEELRARLLALLPPARCGVAEVARLDALTGAEIADAVASLRDELPQGADLAVSHGQTVHHWVEGGTALGTMQIGRPALIAEKTGLPVISDVRSADIAAGGQGAPLAGMLDVLVLRGLGGPPVTRAALNLGGIANVTVLAPSGAAAYDTGPANCLIDAAVQAMTNGCETFDRDGAHAGRGQVDTRLLGRLLADPYFALPAPKSTGREHFHAAYVDGLLDGDPPVRGDDLVATLTELTAVTVADALRGHGITQVFGSGGGMHNPDLVRRLRRHLAPATLEPSTGLGLPVDGKEACLMALLGYLTWHGIPGVPASATGGTLTGAGRAVVLGSISPGRDPLVLPEPCPPPLTMTVDAGDSDTCI